VSDLPTRAQTFWLLITAAASGVLAVSFVAALADHSHILAALFFVAAASLAQLFDVRLPSSRPGASVLTTVSSAACVAVVLLFPSDWAVLVTAGGMLVAELVGRKRAWFKSVYNVANVTLSTGVASQVWQLGRGDIGLDDVRSIPWVIAAALAYFLANSALNAAIVALVLRLPVGLTWWRTNRNILRASLGVIFVGVPMAGLWQSYPWMLVCIAIAMVALHHALDDRSKLETQTLESLFELADILDDRDKYTHGHSERVGHYAEQLAVQLGLSGDRAHLTFLAGRLHDIGKCAINNEVLLKPAALDDHERGHMQRHPEVGSAMLAHFTLFREVAQYVRGHHERWDGGGYPDGLAREAIPLEARIIAVVDSYDAMTTTRPYRQALPLEEATRRLRAGADRQWDPRVVDAFIEWLEGQGRVGAQAPVAAMASSGPGQGGVVTISTSNAAGPVARN
jgi:HD-GYP domain-containing protein (c-di-GMP phosphodiesterase class II)